jgi:hypothetical protein
VLQLHHLVLQLLQLLNILLQSPPLLLLLLQQYLLLGRLKRRKNALTPEPDREPTVRLLLTELLLHRMLVVERHRLRANPTSSTSTPNSTRETPRQHRSPSTARQIPPRHPRRA